MDFLQLVWTEFPELQKVIRVGYLPLDLAVSPLDLVSWLLVTRKLGINLNEFPWILRDFTSVKPFQVALFHDDGPPVIGLPSHIESIRKSSTTYIPCPSTPECGDCYCFGSGPKRKLCPSKPSKDPFRLVLDVDADFSPAPYVEIDNYQSLTNLGPLTYQFGKDQLGCGVLYHHGTHGTIQTPSLDRSPSKSSRAEMDNVSEPKTFSSLRTYLISLSEYTDNTELPEVFSDFESINTPSSRSSAYSTMSREEEAWKKRPNEDDAQV